MGWREDYDGVKMLIGWLIEWVMEWVDGMC